MAEKLFYSMGEVAEMFDVNQSLIRHWESQFSVLRPKRNKKGNRLFSPQDVENLKLIYHLVKERGMTLEGAKKALRQPRADGGVRRDAELMERLQRIRALLVEVREDLKAAPGEIVDDEPVAGESAAVESTAVESVARETVAACRVAADADAGGEAGAASELADAPAPAPAPASASAPAPAAAPASRRSRKAVVKISEADPAAEPEEKPAKAPRKPRRKKEDAEHKELFAFYEQSLF